MVTASFPCGFHLSLTGAKVKNGGRRGRDEKELGYVCRSAVSYWKDISCCQLSSNGFDTDGKSRLLKQINQ